MTSSIPKIDTRDSTEVFSRALELAREHYCPTWHNVKGDPDQTDPGVVLLILLSRLAETVINQINRIPEKHRSAFYDFLGLDHRPPTSAKAALTFELALEQNEVMVPARTRVASSLDQSVVFETEEALTAVNVTVDAAFTLDPEKDRYEDHSKAIGGQGVFSPFTVNTEPDADVQIMHALYLADDLFSFEIFITKLTLMIESDNIDFSLSSYKQFDGKGVKLTNPTRIDRKYEFYNIILPKIDIDNTEASWLMLTPSALPPELSKIREITFDVEIDNITIDAVWFNNTPLEARKGFYPFGRTPQVGDAFYISSKEAFSKTGATISLIFGLNGGKKDNKTKLKWELWNGTIWSNVTPLVKDNTDAFTRDKGGKISFKCPNIPEAEFNGVIGRWIRVRIEQGGYGREGEYIFQEIKKIVDQLDIKNDISVQEGAIVNLDLTKKNITADFISKEIVLGGVYNSPSYCPPFINTISCKVCLSGKTPNYCKSYNNFEYKNITLPPAGPAFSPFENTSRPLSFYIGFKAFPLGKPISLFFSPVQRTIVQETSLGEKVSATTRRSAEKPLPCGVWEYWNGDNWAACGVEDETKGLTQSGIVSFIAPQDSREKNMFGIFLYWIRAKIDDISSVDKTSLKEDDTSSNDQPISFSGIFPNTTWAEHASLITEELLGSSNGKEDQVFKFASTPVLGNQVVEVQEPEMLTADELKETTDSSCDDPVRLIKNDSGDVEQIWVRWKEASSFSNSTPKDRHYIMDRVLGQVLFGDGIRGMIPPALTNNIKARRYKSGGGRNGNQTSLIITSVNNSIAGVKGVTNYAGAFGGSDFEAMDALITRAPYSIQNNGRAVIKEDFEWLAREASPEVFKARCVDNNVNGDIEIYIVPFYASGALYPEPGLLQTVVDYLKDRAFFAIVDHIKVNGPTYKKISVYTEVIPKRITETALVQERIHQKLQSYFHPVLGGKNNRGWDFGQDVYLSDIAAQLESVEGVEHITVLTLTKDSESNGSDIATTGAASDIAKHDIASDRAKCDIASAASDKTWIDIADNELPCAGEIKFNRDPSKKVK